MWETCDGFHLTAPDISRKQSERVHHYTKIVPQKKELHIPMVDFPKCQYITCQTCKADRSYLLDLENCELRPDALGMEIH